MNNLPLPKFYWPNRPTKEKGSETALKRTCNPAVNRRLYPTFNSYHKGLALALQAVKKASGKGYDHALACMPLRSPVIAESWLKRS